MGMSPRISIPRAAASLRIRPQWRKKRNWTNSSKATSSARSRRARSRACGSRAARAGSQSIHAAPSVRRFAAAKRAQSASQDRCSGAFRNPSRSRCASIAAPPGFFAAGAKTLPGRPQNFRLPFFAPAKSAAVPRRFRRSQVRRREPSFGGERLRRNEQRVAGEGGGPAVGESPGPRRRHGKNLPDRESRRGRPVQKAESRKGPEIPDGKRTRQRGRMEQIPAARAGRSSELAGALTLPGSAPGR